MICCCCTADAKDVTDIYERAIDTRLTLAMNNATLSFLHSTTDPAYTYMSVDIFTASTGYNNTICTGSTTANWCSSCYYNNCRCDTLSCCRCLKTLYKCCSADNLTNFTETNNISSADYNGGYVGCTTGTMCSCDCNPFTLANLDCYLWVGLYIRVAGSGSRQCKAYGWNVCLCINNPDLCWGHSYGGTCSSFGITCCACIEYCRISACTFDIYCNGTCLCQLSDGTCKLCWFACVVNANACGICNTNAHGTICRAIYGKGADNKVVCICKKFADVCDVYFTYEGTECNGCIRYDLRDDAGSVICCDLVPNCLYLLDTSYPCVSFSINLYADTLQNSCFSCIKCYGIGVGI
jgi:hypothetical protein